MAQPQTLYEYHGIINKQNECAEVFLPSMYEFNRGVGPFINALLNSCGGIIKVGIGADGYVSGIHCPRKEEDNIKLTVDNTLRFFHPKVTPSLYRLDFVQCETFDYQTGHSYDVGDTKVVEIHVSAGTEILYMDRDLKSMVLHNGRPMELYPQQIRKLAVAKYKQEVLHADTLWDVITPACLKKKESKLKKPTAVICTQTTPGLAPIITPRPKQSSSVSSGLEAPDNLSTPCPTPVASLFNSPDQTPVQTVIKDANNNRRHSPDNSGSPASVVRRMPSRSCKSQTKRLVEASPDVVCMGSYEADNDVSICIIDETSSPGNPFADESNGQTVVRRMLRSSRDKTHDDEQVVKNPKDLFNEDRDRRSKRKSRKRHAAGESRKHRRRSKESKKSSHSDRRRGESISKKGCTTESSDGKSSEMIHGAGEDEAAHGCKRRDGSESVSPEREERHQCSDNSDTCSERSNRNDLKTKQRISRWDVKQIKASDNDTGSERSNRNVLKTNQRKSRWDVKKIKRSDNSKVAQSTGGKAKVVKIDRSNWNYTGGNWNRTDGNNMKCNSRAQARVSAVKPNNILADKLHVAPEIGNAKEIATVIDKLNVAPKMANVKEVATVKSVISAPDNVQQRYDGYRKQVSFMNGLVQQGVELPIYNRYRQLNYNDQTMLNNAPNIRDGQSMINTSGPPTFCGNLQYPTGNNQNPTGDSRYPTGNNQYPSGPVQYNNTLGSKCMQPLVGQRNMCPQWKR